jgi:hypothetical protein
MGEGTNRVEEQPATADQLAEQVERSRERLDTLVAELDQRRHLGSRLRRALSDHKLWLVGAVVLVLAAVGTTIPLLVRHRRQQRTIGARLQHLGLAVRRMVHDPEKVAKPTPDVGRKVLATAATSLTGMLVKRVGERALARRK